MADSAVESNAQMGAMAWLQLHWLDILQSIGIVSGLFFTAVSIRTDSNVQPYHAH